MNLETVTTVITQKIWRNAIVTMIDSPQETIHSTLEQDQDMIITFCKKLNSTETAEKIISKSNYPELYKELKERCKNYSANINPIKINIKIGTIKLKNPYIRL